MKAPTATAHLEPDSGSFVIENYQWARPLSSFLPGIAGRWGVPMWVYYVNRGQVISSAGVRDKDGQIIEFHSFNKACLRVAREGFRTFLRVDGRFYEPFRKVASTRVRQVLSISAHEVRITEHNAALGLDIEVVYFTLAHQPLAALARTMTVRNVGSSRRDVQWVDGLARILPYGLDQQRIKMIPRHIEGMMGVERAAGAPVFRLKQTPDDVEVVGKLTAGHFYLCDRARYPRDIFVDPTVLFAEELELDHPWRFAADGLDAVRAETQYPENRTPCAFASGSCTLAPGDAERVASAIGMARDDEQLAALAKRWRRRGFVDQQREINREVVETIGQRCFTASGDPAFDAYCQQTFVDNVMRGGLPVPLATRRGDSAFYVFSRQNGDLERDYHFFVVEPTYMSQGTGHYRSVLQNRRMDSWFYPEVGDANLRTFVGLWQLDGYNPLEVNGTSYRAARGPALTRWLRKHVNDKARRAELERELCRAFTPGALVMRLEQLAGEALSDHARERCLDQLMPLCEENEVGGLHEGFWIDHWHYNLDLVDTYLMVYPDRLAELLLAPGYTFFDDPDVIVPRADKTVDAGDGRVRRYGAVVRDERKVERIAARAEHPYRARTRGGDGELYRTTLLVKLLCVVVNRLATLDPGGTGMDMEAGKPAWNDSMNGLPGLFGSALGETLELRRAVRLLERSLGALDDVATVALYDELAEFLRALLPAMRARVRQRGDAGALRYFTAANDLKERYRELTRDGVGGGEVDVPRAELLEFLAAARAMLDAIFSPAERARVMSPDGVPYTYFENIVTQRRAGDGRNSAGYARVDARRFEQRPVKLFLEGVVHWMKERPEEAADVYRAVRRSKLFDRELEMYKACEPMVGESFELGRAVGAYPRGWIENESIYLHMELKYLLEILRSGLCAEFWRDARTCLMPFLDPATYGRSTLEGASFVVSSAYADPRRHGQAFQPRLSGVTCEMLHIWTLAVAGPAPLYVDDRGKLALALAPRLPEWLFSREARQVRYHDSADGWRTLALPADAFAFKLLGRTLVVYHNPRRRPTYGADAATPREYAIERRDGGKARVVRGSTLGPALARAVRDGKVRRIDVKLG